MNYREKLNRCKGQRDLISSQMDNLLNISNKYKTDLIILEKAQVFIQETARKTQERLKYHIEDVVNLAINALFPGEYIFKVDFNIKYGKTSADLIFEKKGFEVDILKAAGGGLVDIATLALRVAVWSISKTENFLILDEPVARIQPASLQQYAWEIIKELSKRLNLQFIIVSNSTNNGEATHLIADKEFLVEKNEEEIRETKWLVSRITQESEA